MSIRMASAFALWMAVCALSACGSQPSSRPSSESQAPPTVSPSPVSSEAPAAAADTMFLTVEQVNAIITDADPQASALFSPDPIRHEPDRPFDGLAASCAQVLPLYFGAGEPRFSSYGLWTAAGAGNVFVSQLVARYGSAAEAATKFAQLSENVPACADAATAESGFTLTAGASTSDSVQFVKTPAGANRSAANSQVVNNEYRLVGDSIIGVSATEAAAVVTTVIQQLGNRVGG